MRNIYVSSPLISRLLLYAHKMFSQTKHYMRLQTRLNYIHEQSRNSKKCVFGTADLEQGMEMENTPEEENAAGCGGLLVSESPMILVMLVLVLVLVSEAFSTRLYFSKLCRWIVLADTVCPNVWVPWCTGFGVMIHYSALGCRFSYLERKVEAPFMMEYSLSFLLTQSSMLENGKKKKNAYVRSYFGIEYWVFHGAVKEGPSLMLSIDGTTFGKRWVFSRCIT